MFYLFLGLKACTADNLDLLNAIKLALEGKDINSSKNNTDTTDSKNSRKEKVETGKKVEEDVVDELSDVEETKLKKKNWIFHVLFRAVKLLLKLGVYILLLDEYVEVQ